MLAETGGYGADVVIECVGHPDAVNEGLEYCRDGARFLVLGQYANAGNISFNPHTITRKQLLIAGSWGFEPRHVDRALRLLEARDGSNCSRSRSLIGFRSNRPMKRLRQRGPGNPAKR